MKKVFVVIFLVIIAAAIVIGGYLFLRNKKKASVRQNLPQQIKVKLPTGEVVTAYRMPPSAPTAPTGTRIVISGKVSKETDDIGSVQLVLKSEVGTKYILLNPPYMVRIEKDGIGKKVKVKGVTIARTTFKNYPAIYIEDILEIR